MTWLIVVLVVVAVLMIALEVVLRRRGGGADGPDPVIAVYKRHPVLTVAAFALVLGLTVYVRVDGWG